MDTKNIGLRNIEVADTRISNIDGQRGKLIYRGYDVLDLTKRSSFEEVSYLLLHVNLPTKSEFEEYKSRLVEARLIPKQMQKNMAVGPLEEDKWFETRSQVLGRNLAAGATGVKSGLVNDFLIPEYPEADMWLEELLRSSMGAQLARGD